MRVDLLRKARVAYMVSASIVATLLSDVESTVAAEIEEIVVAATKRGEQLQDAPLSVSVVTSRTLEDAGVHDIFDMAGPVPSFDVAQSTGPLSTSMFIRRIGNLGSIPSFESAVGVFVDGAYRNRAGVALGDLFDLRQVEIVRGPQTTLHGKNTTAGLVSIASNPPRDFLEFRGKLTAGVVDATESSDLVRLEGVINAPLSSNMSVRAGAVVYKQDAILLNIFNGDDGQELKRYSARGQLRHSNGEKLEVRLIANRMRIDSARMGDFVLFEGNAIQGINAGFGVPCPNHSIDAWLFCRNDASVLDLTTNDLTLNIHGSFGDLSFWSISNFEDYESSRDFDADQLNINAVHVIDRQYGSGFSQELRLASKDHVDPTWLVGAFFLDNRFRRGSPSQSTAILGSDAPNLELLPGLPVGSPGNQGFFDSDSDTQHLSVFGNVEFDLSDAFSVRAGLRWQTEDKRTVIVNTADHAGPTAITLRLMPAFSDASLSRASSGISWELTGQYRWSDALTGYLSASHGLKSGGFNAGFGATPPQSREFDDEEVDSVELGVKSVLMGGQLHLNAAVFDARYRNFQSAGWVSLQFLVNNAERVEVRGLEVDLQAVVSERLSTAASVSWVDAHYDRYTNGSCHYDRSPDNSRGTACDLSGQELPLAPRLRSSVNIVYRQPLGPGKLYSRFDWSWSSDYLTNSTLDPRHVQPSHYLVNVSFGYRFDHWDVSAWVQNAGNELVVMREGPSNLFPRDPAYGRAFAMPRTFGLTLSAYF